MNRIVTTIGLSAAALALVLVPGSALATPTAPGSAAPTATAPARQGITVKVSNPTGAHAPVTFTITGLTDGQWVDVDGQPHGWAREGTYHTERQQSGTGPMRIVLDAPSDGWPAGTYEWTVTLPGGVYVHKTTTFTPRTTKTPQPTKTPKPAKTTRPPQSGSGGLARTGV